MKPYIDTHAHLSMLSQGDIPAESRISELFSAGFGGIIDVGTKAEDLPGRIGAFAKFTGVRFSAGIWPSPESIAGRGDLIRVLERGIVEAPQGAVVAVGECGLDRHWNTAEAGVDPVEEGELLELQLDLAERLGLPVIIHSREAAAETAAALARRPAFRGVIHCFSYGVPEARIFLNMGCYISFAGNLTYKNAPGIREALGYIPPDRLLLETDSPYLAPVPYRGKPGEPGMVAETYAMAAELRKIDPDELLGQVSENVRELFGFTVKPKAAGA
ncbi:MAG: TatD family hydrolase [Spirochaetaceae bacterium]|jgi:TatD DNase family protein|nr:TatD family hydrolase [Spirochaetaceae bacterium]